MKRKEIFVIGVSIIIGIIIYSFVIQPGITGYGVYKQIKDSDYTLEDYGKEVNDLEEEISSLNSELFSCTSSKNEMSSELQSTTDRYSKCKNELNNLQISYDEISNEHRDILRELRDELDKKQEEIDELKNGTNNGLEDLQFEYNLLAKNLANNLCCKAKIDNSNINYYKIENNKLVCLESGELRISC